MKMNKNKVTQLLKTGILFLGISLLLWNCEKEKTEFSIESQQSISIEKLKKQFNASFNKDAFLNLPKPQWENARMFYNDQGNQYLEIPFQTIHPQDIERGTSVSFDKLIATSNNDKIELKIVHFFGIDTNNNYVDFKEIFHTELYNFSGFITQYDLNKNVLNAKRYDNGKDTNQVLRIKKDNELLNRSVDEEGTSEFSETICTRGCWYWEYQDGSREYISCSPWVCNTTTYEVAGGNNGGSSFSYNTNEKVEKIDDTNLIDPKIKCLNTKLNSSGSSFIKDILKNFKGESDVDIKIESADKVYGPTGNEVNATTSPIRNGIITIEISVDKSSVSPALAVARTLIHEYIHADMFRKINEDNELHKYPKFKETYDKYKDAKFKATPQHNTMADLYINQMRDALKSYHKNVLVGDYNYLTDNGNGTNPIDDNFYEALAWEGLKDKGVQAYTNLSETKKQNLETSLEQYYHSTTRNCPNN